MVPVTSKVELLLEPPPLPIALQSLVKLSAARADGEKSRQRNQTSASGAKYLGKRKPKLRSIRGENLMPLLTELETFVCRGSTKMSPLAGLNFPLLFVSVIEVEF